MSTQNLIRFLVAITSVSLGFSTTQLYYSQTLRTAQAELYEQHEARMDELEGTLRGHIGIIEGSLERIEGKGIFVGDKKADELYQQRNRDGKEGSTKK